MAALKTSGPAEEGGGGGGALDRSLQHMLRAIVEERRRLALGHDIGGLVTCLKREQRQDFDGAFETQQDFILFWELWCVIRPFLRQIWNDLAQTLKLISQEAACGRERAFLLPAPKESLVASSSHSLVPVLQRCSNKWCVGCIVRGATGRELA